MRERKSLGYMLAKLYRLHSASVKEKIKHLDILPGHLPLIATLLGSEEPMTQDAIACNISIDKSVAARGIDQLEQKGFLTRAVNPEDRRQKLVTATDLATDIKEVLFDSLNTSSDELLKALTFEEKEIVLDLLDRMLLAALKK